MMANLRMGGEKVRLRNVATTLCVNEINLTLEAFRKSMGRQNLGVLDHVHQIQINLLGNH